MKIAKSKDKESLLKLINEFYFTNNCVITDSNEVVNTKLNKSLGIVKLVRGAFEYHAFPPVKN